MFFSLGTVKDIFPLVIPQIDHFLFLTFFLTMCLPSNQDLLVLYAEPFSQISTLLSHFILFGFISFHWHHISFKLYESCFSSFESCPSEKSFVKLSTHFSDVESLCVCRFSHDVSTIGRNTSVCHLIAMLS